jgi:hypothetical protein
MNPHFNLPIYARPAPGKTKLNVNATIGFFMRARKGVTDQVQRQSRKADAERKEGAQSTRKRNSRKRPLFICNRWLGRLVKAAKNIFQKTFATGVEFLPYMRPQIPKK